MHRLSTAMLESTLIAMSMAGVAFVLMVLIVMVAALLRGRADDVPEIIEAGTRWMPWTREGKSEHKPPR